jgi:hypothetical protein
MKKSDKANAKLSQVNANKRKLQKKSDQDERGAMS